MVTVLRVEGGHRDVVARGINVVSSVVSLLLTGHDLAGAENGGDSNSRLDRVWAGDCPP